MKIRTAFFAMLAAGCGFAAAAPAGAADLIRIVSVTPAGGSFPMSPAMAQAIVAYDLESAPYGRIAVHALVPIPSPPPHTVPRHSFTPAWVARGKGQVSVSFTLACDPTTGSGPVTGILAQLHASQNGHEPLGALLQEDTAPNRYTYSCGAPDSNVPKRRGLALLAPDGTTFEASMPWVGSLEIGFDGGPGDASRTLANRLVRVAPLDVVAVASDLILAGEETRTLGTRVDLPLGTRTVDVKLEAGNAVAETREDENEPRVGHTLHRRDAGPRR